MESKLGSVANIIRTEGNEVKTDEFSLEYSDKTIWVSNIVNTNLFTSWFESDNHSYHRIKIYHNHKKYFEWEPITHNPVFGCHCGYLKYVSDTLIFIYKEKHDVYIVSIDEKKVSYFNFHGETLCINQNMIYYEEYLNINNGRIGRISIPNLKLHDEINKAELNALNLELINIQEMYNE